MLRGNGEGLETCATSGGIHNEHTLAGGVLDVDVVDTRARASDYLQLRGGVDHVGVHLRCVSVCERGGGGECVCV